MNTIRIVIIEDNDEIREAYTEMLNGHQQLTVARHYPDCETALKEITSVRPDVVLMDIDLKDGMSGIEGTARIKKLLPRTEVIIVSVHSESDLVFAALCAGASGYLSKSGDMETLSRAVLDIHQGGAPMSSHIARKVVSSFQKNHDTPLTRRESEVLQQLATGKTTPYIAEDLKVSKETIRTHIKNIYLKLQANNKAEALEKARKDRLI